MTEQIKYDQSYVDMFYDVIENKKIRPVYQPIFSLKDGTVFGYEALSRISDPDIELPIHLMFSMAKTMGNLWELEKISRIKALEGAQKLPQGKKLFLNVDANVLLDDAFETGVTKKYLGKYDLKPEDIVFEITERSDVENKDILKRIIEHYKSQSFGIAIDDVGSGYSGLNRINFLTPGYLKIDYELVHKIDKSKSQKSLVELIVKHCRNMKYNVIAEGIETEEELKCVLKLGVSYGQGFLLGRPDENFTSDIDEPLLSIIKSTHRKRNDSDAIESISDTGTIVTENDSIFHLYSLFAADAMLNAIVVVDAKNKFTGIVKRDFFEKNWWYYSEKGKRTVVDYISKDAVLTLQHDTLKQDAIKRALSRRKNTYDPVVVLKKDRFQGIIEVKKLILSYIDDR